MRFACLSCSRFEFDVQLNDEDFKRAPVVALTCPACGRWTAIQQRPGGGIEIALDKHLEKERG